MTKVRIFITLMVVSALISACAVGSSKFPGATAGFQPQKVYAINKDKLFDKIIVLLGDERIGVVSNNKSEGKIVTDYVQGESQFQVVMAITTRYNYTINLYSLEDSKTRVNILCKLESMSKGHTWHEVSKSSKDNERLVTKLENWLYEKIEKSI